MQRIITVAGGGLAGLVAAITCAEAGARVRLLEAHHSLGGRARATAPPYVAHDGPHVLYCDGPWWRWLAERDLLGPFSGVPLRGLAGFRFRHDGRMRRTPPAALLRVLARRRRRAPADVDFHTWIRGHHGERAASAASNLMGVATFDADPGRLSAAFVWERLLRVFAPNPPARYLTGGWTGLVDRLAGRARALGVVIETGARVTGLPASPVIVATSLDAAGRLLGTALPGVHSGRTLLLDLAVRADRRDAFVVSDLDAAGWLERYTLPDPSLAPPGESLIQAQLPLREGEGRAGALARLEGLVGQALPGWQERVTWRRHSIANRRTGALDLPGRTWRDRPAVERGDGVFLAGDMVAAPGLLSEVSFHSGIAAARGALAHRP
ncbi:NAD(P)-binding protein [Sphaerisporangium sp. NBC_01403]|uniref:FAD-dependent oxidoreductase n=1 Tax=Sphaerisporangium sp. NBC_01403 TaxID=2903599 RepID=UPI003250B61B